MSRTIAAAVVAAIIFVLAWSAIGAALAAWGI